MSALNRAPGIEWLHPDPARRYTINPLGVWCLNGCKYCYGRRVAGRLPCPDCQANRPHEHLDRLPALKRARQGDGVFVCSAADLWSDGVEPEWRREIIMAARETAATPYILTKRPDRIRPEDWDIPFGGEDEHGCAADKIVMGVSVTKPDEAGRIVALTNNWPGRKMISFEPLLEDMGDGIYPLILNRIDYVVIGGLSGRWIPSDYRLYDSKHELRTRQRNWAGRIIKLCRLADIPVLVKTRPIRIPLPVDYQTQQWLPQKEV